MTADASKVTIHMVSSLDFYIASKDGSVSWMDTPDTYEKGITEEGAGETADAIDCFVLGSRTYELALTLGWPYGDVPTIVLTHRVLPNDRKTVEFYSGDLNLLVNSRLKPRYRNIWLVGGAALAQDFIHLKLADDLRLTIVPIILGGGMRFLDHMEQEQRLHLRDIKGFKNGLVDLWYEVRK